MQRAMVELTQGFMQVQPSNSNHQPCFNNISMKYSTELGKHVWKLKEADVLFSIKWNILKHAAP